ncbi:hypothetical protein JYQ29_07440 [Curtobacterium flaccumfaciens pv. flaccumfaciens]|uniref:hypothetical protein n=1 Tax=Curtobacterium flaccumfaciens TaxID=2035 RepID=UPI001ADB8C57|nr:hypothetical protein [Curtobacterium flaccumfaciens]MBO9047708.1 hypothetical protein [Curtobacterium flaccumfaciens pv. flaccumfaciens]MBO9056812.1 hypothetical protein [Curtobacterium flaccumfaciens pv. flaccumfaciens]QTR89842.1 hypothetical protein JG550_002514 [Curtobacterium flaccumfaciens pv. flaccumfaciens]
MGTETGELATWPPAAVAVVVAALCTAAFTLLVAVVGGLWAVIRWRRDVAREQRDRAWSRFVWVVDHVTDADVGHAEIGRLVAGAMYNMQVLRKADEVIGKLVLELVTEEEQT